MPAFHESAHEALPRLSPDNYRITSPASWTCNCIAWAAGATDAWWWPIPGRYWPSGVPREETLAAFAAAFATLGYSACPTGDLEPSREKIALYALNDLPTHAARQLPNGWWTSKLGPSIDIEHATPEALTGGTYGEVVAFFARTTTS